MNTTIRRPRMNRTTMQWTLLLLSTLMLLCNASHTYDGLRHKVLPAGTERVRERAQQSIWGSLPEGRPTVPKSLTDMADLQRAGYPPDVVLDALNKNGGDANKAMKMLSGEGNANRNTGTETKGKDCLSANNCFGSDVDAAVRMAAGAKNKIPLMPKMEQPPVHDADPGKVYMPHQYKYRGLADTAVESKIVDSMDEEKRKLTAAKAKKQRELLIKKRESEIVAQEKAAEAAAKKATSAVKAVGAAAPAFLEYTPIFLETDVQTSADAGSEMSNDAFESLLTSVSHSIADATKLAKHTDAALSPMDISLLQLNAQTRTHTRTQTHKKRRSKKLRRKRKQLKRAGMDGSSSSGSTGPHESKFTRIMKHRLSSIERAWTHKTPEKAKPNPIAKWSIAQIIANADHLRKLERMENEAKKANESPKLPDEAYPPIVPVRKKHGDMTEYDKPRKTTADAQIAAAKNAPPMNRYTASGRPVASLPFQMIRIPRVVQPAMAPPPLPGVAIPVKTPLTYEEQDALSKHVAAGKPGDVQGIKLGNLKEGSKIEDYNPGNDFYSHPHHGVIHTPWGPRQGIRAQRKGLPYQRAERPSWY